MLRFISLPTKRVFLNFFLNYPGVSLGTLAISLCNVLRYEETSKVKTTVYSDSGSMYIVSCDMDARVPSIAFVDFFFFRETENCLNIKEAE